MTSYHHVLASLMFACMLSVVHAVAELDRDLIELSLEASYLGSSMYSDYSVRCPPSECPQSWNVLSEFQDSDDAAVLIRSRVGDTNYCVVAFRGTTQTFEDWLQNLNPFTTNVCVSNGGCCTTRAGFADAYFSNYAPRLEEDAIQCLDDCGNDCELVLTGQSQGGAIASIASLVFHQYDPIVITFGQPATFQGSCPPVEANRYYRFVNTILESGGDLEYDPVPFLIDLGADHLGDMIIMGDDVNHVAFYPDGTSPGLEIVDADYDAHRWRSYIDRLVDYLSEGDFPLKTDGWSLGSACNAHSECVSPHNCFNQVCQAGRNGEGCNYNSDCQSGRCEGYTAWVTGGKCYAKLGKNRWCDENSDCISNRCRPSWRGIKCA